MNKYYYIFIFFMAGVIIALIQFDPVVPVHNNQEEKPYYSGVKGRNQVSLTFNVDWGQEYIPDLVEVLVENDLQATFFITGSWAQKNPRLVKSIAQKGQEVGNHGFRHRHLYELDKQELERLLKKNEDPLLEITGQRTDLFAPPYGDVDTRIASIAAQSGYRTIMWSVDTIDWKKPDSEIIIQRAVNKIEDGGIILMHPTQPTVEALPEIITRIQERGFEFVPVSELIEY
ncbi:MAG: polysaccharide deacetylase family protein [Halanaerobiales bacterium]